MTGSRIAEACAGLLGAFAALAGAGAAVFLLSAQEARGVLLGLCLHAAAIVCVAGAGALSGLPRSEAQLLAVMAAVLPGFGPLLAAGHCLVPRAPQRANAHAAHDEPGYRPAEPRPELEREVGVVGYARILREGTLEQKRNLLRRLARLGDARYLGIVRRFLEDAEPELRLCAYAELAAIGERHEAGIAGLRAAVDAQPAGTGGLQLAELAAAQLAYATCGALDGEMAKYWLEQAEQAAARAHELAPESLDVQRALALVLAAAGRVDEAWQIVSVWPEDVPAAAELARAELGFRRRDRRTCAVALARLEANGEPVPAWLHAVAGQQPQGAA